MTVPKIIHCCWFGGARKSVLLSRCMQTWRDQLTGFELREWDESNVSFDTPFLKNALKKKNWAFISDYIRMRVLYEYGGVYLDTDIEVVRNFDRLLEMSCFLGYESKGRLNTAVLGAERGHEFCKKCMDVIDMRFGKRQAYMIAPEVATLVSGQTSSNMIELLPVECFYPYNPYDSSRDVDQLLYADVTENTYAIHHWAKNWKLGLLARIKRGFFV